MNTILENYLKELTESVKPKILYHCSSKHSGMLNSTGLKIMDKCYSIWIKNISKSKKLDIKVFEKCAKK